MTVNNNSPASPLFPGNAMLTFSTTVRRQLEKALSELSGGKAALVQKQIADCIPLRLAPDVALAGPLLGAPAAALAVEELHRRGMKRLVVIGTAGYLASEKQQIRPCSIVYPVRTISEEGTSMLYGAATEENMQPSALQRTLAERLHQEWPEEIPHVTAWTTDAPYLEEKDKISRFVKRGAEVVEMEAAAVYAVCKARGIELAYALIVSDIWTHGVWSRHFTKLKTSTSLPVLARAAITALVQPAKIK